MISMARSSWSSSTRDLSSAATLTAAVIARAVPLVEANEAPSVREPRRRGRKKQPKLNLSPEAQAQRQYDIAVEEVVNDELREDRVSLNRMVHDAKDFNGVSVDEDGRDGG